MSEANPPPHCSTMSISPEQEALIGRVFESYLTEHHPGDLLQLAAAPGEEDAHRAVVVNAMTLFEANMEVGDYFNAYPHEVLAIFDKVLQRKAQELSDEASQKQGEVQRLKHTLHARITGLPVCPELTRVTVPRSRDVGHFLSLTGTVIRTSIAKVLESERDYMCAKCRHVFTVQADFHQHYSFAPPAGCPHPAGCSSAKFSCLSSGSEPAQCRDYQEIKIQEQVQRLSVGSIPRSLVVVLEDDLVDSCKSGDDVTVFGVMCLRWRPLHEGVPCDVELVLKANNIEVNNQQAAAALLVGDIHKDFEEYWSEHRRRPMAGRNNILLSLCPQVFGMYVIKLAVAMVLAGGVQRTDSSGTKIRGECHMLLVGDPGTGKSQFLKYAAKVMPRSVLTAGIGSTSAGLTVAAVKDGGEWHLEAGALVLADGGLCCIDEFSSIKEQDRISIHEAMEQQSISVAKAGMVCKLNTRTSILAATNPKGQYNSSEPLSVNVALASPLLSRFDLVLVLLDTKNAEWDRIISSFILEDRGPPAEASGLWSMEKMKAYFSLIRGLQPRLSEDANRILARYYQLQRQSHGRNAARTTVRMLESLSRLAEAHARLMFRETVTVEDAVVAVSLMECSMQGGGLLGDVNALLTAFPADPDRQYRTQCELLLGGLDLPLLLRQETLRLQRLQSGSSEDSPGPRLSDQMEDEASETLGEDLSSDLCPDPVQPVPRPPLTSTPADPDRKSRSAPCEGPPEEPCGEGGRGPGTRSLGSLLREKVQTEPAEDLQHKLSSFMFRPKKMTRAPDLESACRPRDTPKTSDPPQTLSRPRDTPKTSDPPQTLSRPRDTPKTSDPPQTLSRPRDRRTDSFTPQEPDGASLFREKPGSRRRRRDEAAELRTRAGETGSPPEPPGPAGIQTGSPPGPPGPAGIQTSVGAAAVAKLSRFSFTSSEPRRTDGGTPASRSPLRKRSRRSPGPEGRLDSPPGSVGVGKGAGPGPKPPSQPAAAALFSGLPGLDAAAACQDVFDTDWDREPL
ncbi:DNA helicase MCM9 isoform X2 [Salarias fasciatus]|uniref:DNA helicase MCM9 isoform X2 n=1 Tax=Salarias fasciatus TaxID=181472 RepID=UPI001176DFB9|nr:DNA helicase MCM9 isoform X2 [Salarias fasciatus]